MKKNKGFTLIEVLAVIIIIGIIALIAVPSVMEYLNKAKDSTYVNYEKSMVDAVKNKVLKCISENEDCTLEMEMNQRVYLESLIEEGLIENMKDPESNSFCEAYQSYVNVFGDSPANYKYQACLYCGDYVTDNEACQEIEVDSEDPVCGPKTGESTRWVNINRTVTVACTDSGSGCTQSSFSKTFTTTTKNGKGNIIIRDKSGRVKTCEVNAYVDKTNPTCKVEVEGDKINDKNWYSLEAVGLIKEIKDEDSGVLTYGMGTSSKTRDYNKKESITVRNGITTIMGYVKDTAGNEGICGTEVRVGTNIPVFNLYYGYQIGLDDPNIKYPDITRNNNSLTTQTNSGKIEINNVSKYKDVEKVRITLSSEIETTTMATLAYGEKTARGVMSQGSKKIEFNLEKGTYSTISIILGEIANKTYNVEKIEILTKDGSLWSNKDITLYVDVIDKGMKTTKVSFDNRRTFTTTFNKTFTETTSDKVVTKNGIEMESVPVDFNVKIDRVMPTVTIKAEKSDGTTVTTNTYVNSGLNFTLTQGTVGTSGAEIYYCQDTNNSCEPNIKVTSGTKITNFNTITTNYYFRYKIVSLSGVDSGVNTFTAKFDTTKPVCTFKTAPTVYQTRTATLDMECTDALSGVENKDIAASAFTLNNNNLSIESITKSTITNGIKYTITLKGNADGKTKITLKDSAVKDNAQSGAASINVEVTVKGVFKVTLNNQNATSAGTTVIYELYNNGWYTDSNVANATNSITKPAKNGYIFGGYYTGTNGSGTQIIDANGNIASGKTTQFNADGTLYAKWNECGNGSYCANNTKTACPGGTYGNGTTTGSTQAASCTACGNGYYCAGGTARVACPAGTVGNGTTNGSTQAASCKACPAGYYCTGGTAQTACPAGTVRASTGGTAASSCTTCAAGTYSTGTAKTSCTACGNGAWCTGGSARSTCPAGTVGNGTTNGSTQAASCKACPAGYYCTGGTAQTACPAGTVRASTGGTAASSCTTCAAGTYSTANASTGCSNCGNGAWCTGGSARSTCPAGTVGNGATKATSQSAACKACPAGYYCTGGTNQTACGAGKYRSSTGGTAASSCSTCAAGTYSTANASTGCSNCGNGAWCTGGSARSTCPAGTVGNGATKATSQSAACKACPAGYYCTGGTAQTACGAGKYRASTGGTAASSCSTCAAGTYSTAAASSCTTCAAGTYSAAGSSSCIACTGNTTSGTGSSSCNANCSNSANVSEWNTATWNTNNTVANLCSIKSCSTGYTLSSNKCNINYYYFDLNGWLDGSLNGNIRGYGTCDVYFNGSKVGEDVTDFYRQYPYGSHYVVNDCKATSGHKYEGIHAGVANGYLGPGSTSVQVAFSTSAVQCHDQFVCECCSGGGDYCTESSGCASYVGHTGYKTCWRRNPACY